MKKHLPSFQVLMSRSPVGEDAIFIDGAGRSIQIVPALCGQENNGGLERARKGPGVTLALAAQAAGEVQARPHHLGMCFFPAGYCVPANLSG